MSIFKKDTINAAESCPAYDAFDREPQSHLIGIDHDLTNDEIRERAIINVTAGESIIVRGELGSYTFGSCVSYALANNNDPIKAYQRAIDNGHDTHWINADCTTLTAHETAKERKLVVEIGQTVLFEGRLFTIERAANQNLRLAAI